MDEARQRLFAYLQEGAAAANAAIAGVPVPPPNLIAVVSDAAANKLPAVATGIAKSLWRSFHYAGHTDEWVLTFETAVAAVGKTDDDESHTFLLHALAQGYSRAGQYEKAVETNLRCLERRLSNGDDLGAARSRAGLATTYERQGRYREALDLQALVEIATARDLAVELGDRSSEAQTSNRMADVLMDLGQIDESIRLRGKAIELFEELGIAGGECEHG